MFSGPIVALSKILDDFKWSFPKLRVILNIHNFMKRCVHGGDDTCHHDLLVHNVHTCLSQEKDSGNGVHNVTTVLLCSVVYKQYTGCYMHADARVECAGSHVRTLVHTICLL